MATPNASRAIEALAAEIGDKIYIDIAKWHLYLAEAHLHTVLAERLYPLLEKGSLDENTIVQQLRQISVKVGGGRHELPLADLVPVKCQMDLIDLIEEFQRNL